MIYQNLAIDYLYARRWDEAITAYNTALRLQPGYMGAHYGIGVALLMKGEAEAALEAFAKEERDEQYRVKGTAMALHKLGRHAEHEAKLAELIERWGEELPSEVAHVYAWTGDSDSAFAWLEQAIEQNEPWLTFQYLEPFYASLHADPRWANFRERTGSSEAQLDGVEFEVTLPKQ